MDTVLLKQRDRYSIEVKARYVIDSRVQTRAPFGLRLYFFFPQPFNITPVTYTPQDFFSQLKLNLRFNTPVFTIDELLEPLSDTSPLIRVEKLLHRHRNGVETLQVQALVYEAKMLASVYKSILRDFLLQIRTLAKESPEELSLEKHLQRDVKRLHEVARRFHEFQKTYDTEDLPGDATQHLRMVDEHLSLLLEKYLTTILALSDEEAQPDLYQRIVKTLLKEERYREAMAYPSLPSQITEERQLEEYVYREKMLKKYASEVLFFDVQRRDASKQGEHILYAAAAGIAMMLATGIAFYGQTRYGNLTISLFVLLVVGYMVKDRVKEAFRDILRKRVGRYLNDRKTTIRDRRKRRRIATVTERATFLPEKRLRGSIRKLRNRGYFERALFDQESERVLLYSKRILMHGKNFRAIHERINGVADIQIIDLAPFIRYLSAQYGLIPTIHNKKRVDLKRVKRIYHLNLIVAYDSPDGQVAGRFRLVVDARGIKRIEAVNSDGGDGDLGVRLVTSALVGEDGEFEEY